MLLEIIHSYEGKTKLRDLHVKNTYNLQSILCANSERKIADIAKPHRTLKPLIRKYAFGIFILMKNYGKLFSRNTT